MVFFIRLSHNSLNLSQLPTQQLKHCSNCFEGFLMCIKIIKMVCFDIQWTFCFHKWYSLSSRISSVKYNCNPKIHFVDEYGSREKNIKQRLSNCTHKHYDAQSSQWFKRQNFFLLSFTGFLSDVIDVKNDSCSVISRLDNLKIFNRKPI